MPRGVPCGTQRLLLIPVSLQTIDSETLSWFHQEDEVNLSSGEERVYTTRPHCKHPLITEAQILCSAELESIKVARWVGL